MSKRPRTRTKSSKRIPNRPHRRPLWRSGVIPIGLVVVVVLAIVIVKLASGTASSAGATTGNNLGTTALAPAVLKAVTHVPDSALDDVGSPAGLTPPQTARGSHAVLVNTGKPSIVYVGAEYCPFCATQRWPLVVALSRFGAFEGLRATQSAAGDEYPSTATMSFYGSRYTSPYVNFTPVELNTNEVVGNFYGTLQKPTSAEVDLINTFDVPPYTSSAGTIPFIDFGNRYLDNGASYNPQILQGLTQAQIAADLKEPKTTVAQGVDGTANLMTAAICNLTHDRPQSVCSDEAVTTAARELSS